MVAFDLPGVDPQAIELDVKRDVLTVEDRAATRGDGRAGGDAGRRASTGDLLPAAGPSASPLDADRIHAGYEARGS